MAIEDLIRRHKKTASVVEALERGLRQTPSHKPPMRPSDWLRVSSIGSVCPREEVLRSQLDVNKVEGISADLGLVFEVGHALHWVMQNRAMPAAGGIVGKWRCTWCGEQYGSIRTSMVPRPQACVRCGAVDSEVPRFQNRPDYSVKSDAFLYVEQWLGDNEYRIGGHPDGFWIDGDVDSFSDDDVVVLEFKSASERTFYKYKQVPDFVHVVQVQCYMWLTGFRRSKIIYINKGQFGFSGVAEHDIEYDEDSVARIQRAIKEIRSGLRSGEVPAREACGTIHCERARNCVVAQQCFSEA